MADRLDFQRRRLTEAALGLLPRSAVVLDERRSRPVWFDGLFLTAAALAREQSYVLSRQADLARTLGAGVVEGLEVEEVTGRPTALRIRRGHGLTPTGEVERDLLVELADIPNEQRLERALGRPLRPTPPRENRSGLFVLALRPLEYTAEPSASHPTTIDEPRRLEDSVVREVALVTLVPFADAGALGEPGLRRARAAERAFGGAGLDLPPDVLPLAALELAANSLAWLDVWVARREAGLAATDILGLGLASEPVRRHLRLKGGGRVSAPRSTSRCCLRPDAAAERDHAEFRDRRRHGHGHDLRARPRGGTGARLRPHRSHRHDRLRDRHRRPGPGAHHVDLGGRQAQLRADHATRAARRRGVRALVHGRAALPQRVREPRGRRRPRVMRAVWSFWPRPYHADCHWLWVSERHHLLAWILSVETARQHYPETILYTDSAGARLLVDALELPFRQVSTTLDALADSDAAWWNLGKLHAYRDQEQPFLHIDSDVFLWRPLPRELAAGAVIVQNPEEFAFDGCSWYQPGPMATVLRAAGGWLPEEWTWYAARRVGTALCCGILGGSRVDFLRHYAELAIRVMEHPANRTALSTEEKVEHAVLVEQYLLAACLAFHAARPASPFNGVQPRYLFPTADASRDPEAARRAGYTHLIGAAKADPMLARRLEARVERDYPQQYERVRRLFPHVAAEEAARCA